ncbi:MAG: sugar transferase [Prevotellaceae bacterium]|nr:sugar transferase [Prevotella sp.]MDD7531027.1 sugar transferase [Prevotellaceae bacterium]MDY2634153.1 sugar transferase [Prevotella sp.]
MDYYDKLSIKDINQTASLQVSHDALGSCARTLKRFFDFSASSVGIILLSPIFLVIYIMLLCQRNGSPIFSQERIGYKGKPFIIYKFRTMSSTVEDEGPQLVAQPDTVNSTKLERFIREHHLDELPQLWNVLLGDMSFVGPRPERKYFIEQIMEHTDDYELIFEMRPGLTSEATLYNGYTDTMEKMLKRLDMDIRYLKNRSLGMDLRIIATTIWRIIGGKKF